jgi:hypothetical protein
MVLMGQGVSVYVVRQCMQNGQEVKLSGRGLVKKKMIAIR